MRASPPVPLLSGAASPAAAASALAALVRVVEEPPPVDAWHEDDEPPLGGKATGAPDDADDEGEKSADRQPRNTGAKALFLHKLFDRAR